MWLLLCLFGSGFSGLKDWRTRRLYDKQRGRPNLAALSWQAFERLVGEHFRRRGYRVSATGGSRPDGGIDLVLTKDQERYVVQCKHWKARQVGVSVVRELVGSITQSGAAGGFLVTSGKMTGPAMELANDSGIEVVDGTSLRADLSPHDSLDGVNDLSETSAPPGSPACPICSNGMVLRTARRGRQSGQQFWGCSNFPNCRGTRQLSEVRR
ncbi:restriction endonuclease [Natronocella acetinitrilica]